MRALRADFHVTAVANESEALHAMALQTYDAVLCDVLAPGLNGIELYEHVKEAFPFLAERIVFMAGGMFDESVSDFLVSVPNRRIDKPFRPRALRDLLRHVTTGVRAAREMSAPR